jgi:deoxyribonuclease-1
MGLAILVAALAVQLGPARADPPSNPVSSFSKAKRIARDVIYEDHRTTLYCSCMYMPNSRGTGGKIGNLECGYEPRKNVTRGKRLEWEHIMPAAIFGRPRSCWTEGHKLCVRDGKAFHGRACCKKVDDEFKRIEADLHNLAPAVGELNGDRSAKPYGLIAEEIREYGACDFEVDKRLAEPEEDIRGDVARVWFYMSETYGISLDPAVREMLSGWSDADPPDTWERERDDRIATEQGNHNPFVQP